MGCKHSREKLWLWWRIIIVSFRQTSFHIPPLSFTIFSNGIRGTTTLYDVCASDFNFEWLPISKGTADVKIAQKLCLSFRQHKLKQSYSAFAMIVWEWKILLISFIVNENVISFHFILILLIKTLKRSIKFSIVV